MRLIGVLRSDDGDEIVLDGDVFRFDGRSRPMAELSSIHRMCDGTGFWHVAVPRPGQPTDRAGVMVSTNDEYLRLPPGTPIHLYRD